ncbi:hypothetical protein JTB14_017601 [Gonioctena quinquepunctata]|nr:hypothetical protein JTB14_017601 [Gonioctena quinquepunctata]
MAGLAWLEYRYTPTSGSDKSPAQLLNNRHLRSKLPIMDNMLQTREVDLKGKRELEVKGNYTNIFIQNNCRQERIREKGRRSRKGLATSKNYEEITRAKIILLEK